MQIKDDSSTSLSSFVESQSCRVELNFDHVHPPFVLWLFDTQNRACFGTTTKKEKVIDRRDLPGQNFKLKMESILAASVAADLSLTELSVVYNLHSKRVEVFHLKCMVPVAAYFDKFCPWAGIPTSSFEKKEYERRFAGDSYRDRLGIAIDKISDGDSFVFHKPLLFPTGALSLKTGKVAIAVDKVGDKYVLRRVSTGEELFGLLQNVEDTADRIGGK